MAKDERDDNVISLEARRRAGSTGRRGARGGEARGKGLAEGPGAAGGQPPEVGGEPVPGRLVWLYCPTCGTLEYTEQEMPGGRTHNPCGTQVLEAPVEMDLRAELTLARINLERLELLQSVVEAHRRRYEDYAHRLTLAAGQPLAPYARPPHAGAEPGEGAPGGLAPLPSAEVDALGLLVSPFFRDPAQRFPELAGQSQGDGQPDDTTGADADGPQADPPPEAPEE